MPFLTYLLWGGHRAVPVSVIYTIWGDSSLPLRRLERFALRGYPAHVFINTGCPFWLRTMPAYSITLTCLDGFTADQLVGFKDWFKHNSSQCLLVSERHASGALHLHAGATMQDKQTGQVTRKLGTLYNRLKIELEPNVSIKVKRTTDQIGWFHYLTKDLQCDPLLLTGWKMTWIQEQCLANLKKMPFKMLAGDDYAMRMDTSIGLILAYSKRKQLPISGKASFTDCLCHMSADGYQFHRLKLKFTYAHVMSRLGYSSAVRSLLENELMFLD